MAWDAFLPTILVALVTVVGWFLAHRLSSARDRANKRRDLRTQQLIEALYDLMDCPHRDPGIDDAIAKKIESASARIQLFGSAEQVRLIRQLVFSLPQSGSVSFDDLLIALREDLRKELGLSPLEGPAFHFR